MEDKVLISLITVSFNSEKTIKDTIESVLSQSYENIEYIIVDGASSDTTLEIVKSYEYDFEKKGYIYRTISEKDKGIYDAMNKGVEMASGKLIGILNSDDFYIDNNVIEKVMNKLSRENSDVVYGDLLMVDGDNTEKVIRLWKANKGDFRWGWNPPHPTTFITRDTYKKYGLYKIENKLASDYDLLYRIMHKGKVKSSYLEDYLVKMRMGGASSRGIGSIIEGTKDIYRSLKENGHRLKLLTIALRLIIKVKQLFVFQLRYK